MRYQHGLMAAAFAVMLAAGCRKDKDSGPPSVRITSPGAGFTLNIPDTITVGVDVSDDRTVTAVTVLLADADGVPVAPGASVAVNARSRQVSVDLPIISERLASGQYVLTAMATDGEHDARDFLTITVQAAPLRIRSMLLVPPGNGPPPFTISRIDSAGAVSAFASLSELGQAAIGLDHLFTTGTATLPLQRWRIGNGAAQAIMPNPALWPAYFTGLSTDAADGRIIAHAADGAVRVFLGDGAPVLTAQLPGGFVGQASVGVGDALICAARQPVTQERRLFRIGPSGAVLAQFNSDADAVALFAIDGQRLLFFGNDAAGGVVREVNALLGGGFTMRAFPGEALRCVERVSPALHVLGFDSGIRRLDLPSTAVTTLLPGLAADGLTFNPVSGAVLAATGTSIVPFDPLLGTTGPPLAAPHAVAKVLLQRNR